MQSLRQWLPALFVQPVPPTPMSTTGLAFALGRAAAAPTADKRKQWQEIAEAIRQQTLRVGSRTPLGLPAWVTSDVVSGGFASGSAAGGALLAWERELGEKLKPCGFEGPVSRGALNEFFLSPDGVALLCDALDSRRFQVLLPEEAALLMVVQLQRRGCDVGHILEEIIPHFASLRFYPRLLDLPRPQAPPGAVSVWTVDRLKQALACKRTPVKIQRQQMAQEDFLPVYMALMDLAAPVPPQDLENWLPLGTRVDPHAWAAWEKAEKRLEAKFSRSRRMKRGTYGSMRRLLRRSSSGEELSFRDRRFARRLLVDFYAKYGIPGSADRETRVSAVTGAFAGFVPVETLAAILTERLAEFPGEMGVLSCTPLMADVSEADKGWPRDAPRPTGVPMPKVFQQLVKRVKIDSIDNLVGAGLIKSSEAVARLSTLVVAQTLTSHECPVQCDLDVSLAFAFARRRSLLLLDYASQVKLHELPWCPPHLAHPDCPEVAEASRLVLRNLCRLHMTTWPHVEIPNVALREMQKLLNAAKIKTSLTSDLAADIFMGDVTESFQKAAQAVQAAPELEWYRSYYHLPTDTTGSLIQKCEERAQQFSLCDSAWCNYVARNGAILEQLKIATTHNLYQLYAAGLLTVEDLEVAVGKCWQRVWPVLCLDTASSRYIQKDTAAAFRSLVFALSILKHHGRRSEDIVRGWMSEEPARRAQDTHRGSRQDKALQPAVHLVLKGLLAAAEGRSPDDVYIGWVAKPWHLWTGGPPKPGPEQAARAE